MTKANRLIESTSPYLLQHAYNPVDWYPWGEEAHAKAREEDKPIILSIGYSSCHWCHVMEKESFEDHDVARIMNENFICIKVDREERPDVDHVYMDAVQAMGLQGGWPLNVFLTPEQKPFYGGTYFPKPAWTRILMGVTESYRTKKGEIQKSAEDITDFLRTNTISGLSVTGETTVDPALLDDIFGHLEEVFDPEWGGRATPPKFPMPSIWRFLLRYHHKTGNQRSLDQTLLTLDRMANGAIFDIVAGGFARYSVDEFWKVPHFEKMLYDNGQLLSLYAEALQITGNDRYRQIITRTCEWLRDEMSSEQGLFYSALDADSEGEEGKYYVWDIDEIDTLLEPEARQFKQYYRITFEGNWENGRNVLFSPESPAEFAADKSLDIKEFNTYLDRCYQKLHKKRKERVRPGLDNKIISGWNAITLEGLINAWKATGESWILDMAVRNAKELRRAYIENGELLRVKDEKQRVPGFLDDYAYTLLAYTMLYEATFDESWIHTARSLLDTVQDKFRDKESPYYFYSASDQSELINRKKEMLDNVIPASNSVLALAMLRLGLLTADQELTREAKQMASGIKDLLSQYPEYLTNWACLLFMLTSPTAEAAIVGPGARQLGNELGAAFLPNMVLAGTEKESDLDLLKGRQVEGKTLIYICREGACQLPVDATAKAIDQIRELQDQTI